MSKEDFVDTFSDDLKYILKKQKVPLDLLKIEIFTKKPMRENWNFGRRPEESLPFDDSILKNVTEKVYFSLGRILKFSEVSVRELEMEVFKKSEFIPILQNLAPKCRMSMIIRKLAKDEGPKELLNPKEMFSHKMFKSLRKISISGFLVNQPHQMISRKKNIEIEVPNFSKEDLLKIKEAFLAIVPERCVLSMTKGTFERRKDHAHLVSIFGQPANDHWFPSKWYFGIPNTNDVFRVVVTWSHYIKFCRMRLQDVPENDLPFIQ